TVGDLRFHPGPPPVKDWLVRGQVVDASGPLNAVQVSVYDRDLFFKRDGANSGQLLGAGPTQPLPARNEDGWFEFPYAAADFASGDLPVDGAGVPDLVFTLSRNGQALETFQVFRLPDGSVVTEETALPDPDLILGIEARKVEEVRIVIPGGETQRILSEYERLVQAVEPLLPERAPAGATPNQVEALVGAAALRFDETKYRDISFVARETGFDVVQVQALATAFTLLHGPFQNQFPAAVFYGLVRIRGVSDAAGQGQLSTGDLRQALQQAGAGPAPIIPVIQPPEKLDEIVKDIRSVLADYLPKHTAVEGLPSLADLLGTALPDPHEQAALWSTYSDYVGTPEEFWDKLKSQSGFEDD
ncbi:MAG TPA: hypothetical protein VL359_02465, partial [bacterium]|nr:hypothetical protein [bacterium]